MSRGIFSELCGKWQSCMESYDLRTNERSFPWSCLQKLVRLFTVTGILVVVERYQESTGRKLWLLKAH